MKPNKTQNQIYIPKINCSNLKTKEGNNEQIVINSNSSSSNDSSNSNELILLVYFEENLKHYFSDFDYKKNKSLYSVSIKIKELYLIFQNTNNIFILKEKEIKPFSPILTFKDLNHSKIFVVKKDEYFSEQIFNFMHIPKKLCKIKYDEKKVYNMKKMFLLSDFYFLKNRNIDKNLDIILKDILNENDEYEDDDLLFRENLCKSHFIGRMELNYMCSFFEIYALKGEGKTTSCLYQLNRFSNIKKKKSFMPSIYFNYDVINLLFKCKELLSIYLLIEIMRVFDNFLDFNQKKKDLIEHFEIIYRLNKEKDYIITKFILGLPSIINKGNLYIIIDQPDIILYKTMTTLCIHKCLSTCFILNFEDEKKYENTVRSHHVPSFGYKNVWLNFEIINEVKFNCSTITNFMNSLAEEYYKKYFYGYRNFYDGLKNLKTIEEIDNYIKKKKTEIKNCLEEYCEFQILEKLQYFKYLYQYPQERNDFVESYKQFPSSLFTYSIDDDLKLFKIEYRYNLVKEVIEEITNNLSINNLFYSDYFIYLKDSVKGGIFEDFILKNISQGLLGNIQFVDFDLVELIENRNYIYLENDGITISDIESYKEKIKKFCIDFQNIKKENNHNLLIKESSSIAKHFDAALKIGNLLLLTQITKKKNIEKFIEIIYFYSLESRYIQEKLFFCGIRNITKIAPLYIFLKENNDYDQNCINLCKQYNINYMIFSRDEKSIVEFNGKKEINFDLINDFESSFNFDYFFVYFKDYCKKIKEKYQIGKNCLGKQKFKNLFEIFELEIKIEFPKEKEFKIKEPDKKDINLEEEPFKKDEKKEINKQEKEDRKGNNIDKTYLKKKKNN